MQYGWTALIYAALNGHTATVQYLVEETTAQVNATDNVSNANSVKRCLLYVLVYIHWVLIHVYRRVEILMVLKFEAQKRYFLWRGRRSHLRHTILLCSLCMYLSLSVLLAGFLLLAIKCRYMCNTDRN